MLLIAAALVTAAPHTGVQPAVRQPRASVRIVSGMRLKLSDGPAAPDVPSLRTRTIRTAEGSRPAKLIEFE